ncbi:transposase family protein [Micromonospora parva]|uniref:transposase family protein n=1 Tax=Micromonospora parva TaxID=1464048 RepID=UPI003F4D2FA8
MLTQAHLGNGDTIARLACGFAVSVTTVWRYVREALDLLATHADSQTYRRPVEGPWSALNGGPRR